MKTEDHSRIKINPMEYKGYVFDEPYVLQQIAKGFQITFPQLKLLYPILNTNPYNMFNYVLMGYNIENPNMWFITIAVRFTGISTHAYVYLKQFGNMLMDDYFADIGDNTQFMSRAQFNLFLKSISFNTYVNPNTYEGKQQIRSTETFDPMSPGGVKVHNFIDGLSFDQNEPNYFLANSDTINVFFENVSNLKITIDNTKKAKQ